MSEYIQVEFEGPDAVSYDPATKTATYLASGLSVQFLHEDPPIKDSQTYFRLRSPEGQCDFEVMGSGGGRRVDREFPDASLEDRQEIWWSRKENVMDIRESQITFEYRGNFDEEFIRQFLQAFWLCEYSRRNYTESIFKLVVEIETNNGRRWECRG